jgi:hypothetical protein
MIADDQRTRRELETVAFGRVVTAADEDAAARALQALRELDERASVEPARAVEAGVTPRPLAVEVPEPGQAASHGVWRGAPSRAIESLRRLWVVPLVIASIALGAIGGSLATRQAADSSANPAVLGQETVPPDTDSSSDTTVIADPAAPQPPSDADGASAEDWLNQPRRPIDVFPDEPELIAFGVDPNSTHVVRTEATNVWIARGGESSLCLVMMTTAGSIQIRCTPPELFAAKGVTAEAEDGTTAHWSADGVTVSEPVPGTMG